MSKEKTGFISKWKEKRRNRWVLFTVTFLSAILLIAATYAWFSSSLNVKIKFFKMSVATDTGLFISLDGVEFSDSVLVSMDTIINDLGRTYPNHTSQWAAGGLWPVSSNGIRNSNSEKFDFYEGHLLKTKLRNPNGSIKRILNTDLMNEDEVNPLNLFIGFDIFLKNVSGSPNSDNLYLEDTTIIDFEEGTDDETKEEMSGIMNSTRVGMVRIGSVPLQTDVRTIQNIRCNNSCEMLIFEPFSTNHSAASITAAENYSITLVDGVYIPTYAMIAEGKSLEHTNGHVGTGIPLISSHFALQNTIKESDFENPIFQIPNGITKFRVYIWIEGQDIDSLETYSKGADIYISLDFIKDLAGYE